MRDQWRVPCLLVLWLALPIVCGAQGMERDEVATTIPARIEAIREEMGGFGGDSGIQQVSEQMLQMALLLASPSLDSIEIADAARMVLAAALRAEMSYRLGLPRAQVKAQLVQFLAVAARGGGGNASRDQLGALRRMIGGAATGGPRFPGGITGNAGGAGTGASNGGGRSP